MADVTFKVLVSKEQAEQAWNDIQSKMTAAQGTAKGMTQTLNELKTKLGEAKVGSDAFKELAVRAKQAEDELKRMQSMAIQAASGQKQFVSGVDQASQAIGQFGWVMGDADMFLVNFRMGMMSIGNNIPMVAQAFMRLKDEVQQTGGSMKSALMGALTGSGGVMLGINALMFALNALPKLFGDAKASAESWDLESLAGETDDFAKAMVKLNKEIKSLSSSELDSYLERLSKKLTKLQTDVAEAADKFAGFAVLNSITGIDFGKLLSSDQNY